MLFEYFVEKFILKSFVLNFKTRGNLLEDKTVVRTEDPKIYKYLSKKL